MKEHDIVIQEYEEAYALKMENVDTVITLKLKELEDSYSSKFQALEDDKEQWEKEKKAIASSHTFDTKIKLDVGGTHFTTTLTTLTRFPDSMIGAMFSGRHKIVTDESGYFFIDRDGAHFRHILNYLRCPEDFDASAIRCKEASYYGLESFMFPGELETKTMKIKKLYVRKFMVCGDILNGVIHRMIHRSISGSVQNVNP